ncbi:MAG: hypothetical protein Q7T71_08035, partial [Herbiconiux sp.]|nr:hypothetical protein [Herbiconiux sp.]
MASRIIAVRVEQLESARARLESGAGVLVVGSRGSGRTSFAHAVLDELSESVRGRVWFGDDIERMEPERGEKLAAAIVSGTLVPLLTSERRAAVPAPLARLVDGATVVRLLLEPLTSHELLRVTETVLGAPLDLRA